MRKGRKEATSSSASYARPQKRRAVTNTSQEKTTTFKWYIALNAIVTYVALAVGAVIVIISGVKHNQAVTNCKTVYYAPPPEIKTMSGPLQILNDQSEPICMGFCWADLGMMAGLWAICFVMQSYYVWASSKYSRSQVSDHKLYHSVYSENPEAFTMSILQSRRYNPDSVYFQSSPNNGGLHPNDAWDHRPSYDGTPPPPTQHYQQHTYNQQPQQGGQYSDQPYQGYSDQHPYQLNDRYTDDVPGQPSYPFTQPQAGYVDHSNRV